MFKLLIHSYLVLQLFVPLKTFAEPTQASLVELSKLSFFYGREYFLLRSGRAQMILQADKADLGPAFTFLIFDAQDPAQSKFKDGAFNFDATNGFSKSALEVILGRYPFTAFGMRTETKWVLHQGIPAVEAVWWAGGIRVTERIFGLENSGNFQRSIQLEGANLVGNEAVSLRLSLPPGQVTSKGRSLIWTSPKAKMAITVGGATPLRFDLAKSNFEIGPIAIGPGQTSTIETVLSTQIGSSSSAFIPSGPAPESLVATKQKWAQDTWIQTEDQVVSEMYNKALYTLPAMVADDGAMDNGIFEYGAQWVRDTSNTALGLLQIGEFELARHAIERMLNKMISDNGATMISGSFETPDREQFDQMGEFLHILRSYRDWSGDKSIIQSYRAKILAVIERPLSNQFRDSTGMVHNRREFWEREFEDAYELAYQTWVIQGLRDAVELAPELQALDRISRWKAEADKILIAMLSPDRGLVDKGRLIKRRNLTGEVADLLPKFGGFQPDVPGNTETYHRLLPDASQALPIAMKVVDPKSQISLATLSQLQELWDTRWSDGGYDRYNTSSQPDQPGPWPFATCFIMRALHESGIYDLSRRSLEWLNSVQGGRTGAWFEEIPSVHSNMKNSGIVQWTSAEVALFVVRHWLGISFENEQLVLKPNLYPQSPAVQANIRFRNNRVQLRINGAGTLYAAEVNGLAAKIQSDGSLRLPADFKGGEINLHAR